MIRQITAMLLSMVLLFSCTLSALAAEGNMDGDGGGSLEGVSGDSSWTEGFEGVRVSVIDKTTQKAVGQIVDWLSLIPPDGVVSFTKRNKLQYRAGSTLAPTTNTYKYQNPDVTLPKIISSDGSSNITAVKAYFCDKNVIKVIAKDVSIGYETLTSGKFTILIEPLAIVKYNGIRYAMTATEAALYDRLVSGDLKSQLGYLTHQNQPLCMYLETAELGMSPGGGSGIQANEYIISTLGVGTVNFDDADDADPMGGLIPPPAAAYDYEYRADTDVITAIDVSTISEINPDSPGKATFQLPTGSIIKEYVIPEDESQLVWVKWRTPNVSTTTYYNIPVSVSKGTGGGTIRVKVVPITENTPPDPAGRDRNDGFSLKSPPAEEMINSQTWGEWWASWHANWVKVSTGHKSTCAPDCTTSHTKWEDHGWWDFNWSSYTASLAVTATTMPNERVPTANGGEIKSGYGINANIQVTMTTDGGSGNTSEVQHIIAVFPEFDFKTYNRWLVPEGGSPGYIKTWNFKPNEYSQFNNPVHFTPIWYPDSTAYPVSFTVLDAWTPAGQLKYVLTSSDISIEGNVYRDWHIAPGFGSD